MDELFPVLIAFVLGSLIWRISRRTLRAALSVAAVLAAAFLATALSGEFSRSSIYVLIDLLEAAAGFGAAATLATVLGRRRAFTRRASSARLVH